jgi:hypothetical protein
VSAGSARATPDQTRCLVVADRVRLFRSGRPHGVAAMPQPTTSRGDIRMKNLTPALLAGCLAFAASGAFAMDDMKKGDAMMKKDSMTMQQCKDHMAMAKKDGMKKDDAMMKKDAMCADMMKNDGMKKDDSMMKKDDASMKKGEPMKK